MPQWPLNKAQTISVAQVSMWPMNTKATSHFHDPLYDIDPAVPGAQNPQQPPQSAPSPLAASCSLGVAGRPCWL